MSKPYAPLMLKIGACFHFAIIAIWLLCFVVTEFLSHGLFEAFKGFVQVSFVVLQTMLACDCLHKLSAIQGRGE